MQKASFKATFCSDVSNISQKSHVCLHTAHSDLSGIERYFFSELLAKQGYFHRNFASAAGFDVEMFMDQLESSSLI